MYKKHGVSFLTDQKDLISEYEAQGQGVSTDTPTGLEALSRMNRVQQIEVIHGEWFRHLLDVKYVHVLKAYLKNGY